MYSVSIGLAGLYLAAIAAVVVLNCLTCGFCGLASPQHLLADAVLLVGVIWQCTLFTDVGDADTDGVVDDGIVDSEADADGIVSSYIVILAAFSAVYVFKGILISKEYRKTLWTLLLCRVAAAALIIYALFPGTSEQQDIGSAEPGVVILLGSGVSLMVLVALVST